MYLIFDTETTGLPKKWDSSITDIENWPRLVQIAWILFDKNGKELKSQSFIIRPEDFTIPIIAEEVHGISTEKACREGYHLVEVLYSFKQDLDNVAFLVAHNIEFDEKVIRAEFYRLGIENSLNVMNKICTMKSTVDLCRIPGMNGYKWPKLSELYFTLFDREFTEAHDASLDVRITAKCFWDLMRRRFYDNQIGISKFGSKWGPSLPNSEEFKSNKLYSSSWINWDLGQFLAVKTISKDLKYVYFDNGLVTTNEHLKDENVFIHGALFDERIDEIFTESGVGISLHGDKSEYMVNSEGIAFWRRADTYQDEKLLRVKSMSPDGIYVTFTNGLMTSKEHLYRNKDSIFTFDENVFTKLRMYVINGKANFINVSNGFKGYTNSDGLTFWDKG